MTPAQWNATLAADRPWRTAYKTVAEKARAYLTGMKDDCSTAELAEALYPEKAARGDGILARKRLFKALMVLATAQLADCARRGPESRQRYGRMVRPWRWHAPREVEKCGTCGQSLPEGFPINLNHGGK